MDHLKVKGGSVTITLDEWTAELQRFQPSTDPNALTKRQIAAQAKRPWRWAESYVAAGMAAGTLRKVSKVENGRTVPAYIKVKPEDPPCAPRPAPSPRGRGRRGEGTRTRNPRPRAGRNFPRK